MDRDLDACGSGLVQRFGDQQDLLWFPERHEDIERELVFRIGMLHSTMLYRASILRGFAYMPGVGADDYDQQVRMAAAVRLGNAPELLASHRSHSGQVHIQKATQFRDEMRVRRAAHLRRLFPEATSADVSLITKAAERTSAESLHELEGMGRWLLRLAVSDDPLLRRRMLLRWWVSCTRSTTLGAGCYELFQEVTPQFQAPPVKFNCFALKAACVLKLSYGGLAHRLARLTRASFSTALAPDAVVR
jgi:hypothetical protein